MNFIDQEELENRNQKRIKQHRRNLLWNTLTAITLVSALAMVGFFALLFLDPHIPFNPFPPATLPALVSLPTSTPTIPVMPSTWTPIPSGIPTLTPEVVNTQEVPTPVIVTIPPETVPTFPPSSGGDYPFALEGAPAPMANIVFHPDAGCNWQGVAGQVVDIQGRHLVGVLIRLTGYYDGRMIEMTTLSGGAQVWYGDSGYEFVLGDRPVESKSTLYVQLIDQSLTPISDRVVFDTYDTCDKNLVLINFKQIR